MQLFTAYLNPGKRNYYLLILLLLILIDIPVLGGNNIYFKAKRYRTGLPVKIDSVKIIDNNTGNTFTNKDSSVKKSIITSLSDKDTSAKMTDDLQRALQGLSFFFDKSGNLVIINKSNIAIDPDIKVIDVFGSLVYDNKITLAEDENMIEMNNRLASGAYFIEAKAGNYQNIKKLIFINGEGSPLRTISSDTGILKSNSYNFIAYSGNFKPDTAKDISISEIDTINFVFYDVAKYNFRTGQIVVDSIKAAIYKREDEYRFDGIKTKIYYDTLYVSFTIELGIQEGLYWGYYEDIKCENVINHDSTIVFCIIKNDERDNNHIIVYQYEGIAELDSSMGTIDETELKYTRESRDFELDETGSDSKRFSISLNKLPYNIDNSTGILRSDIEDSAGKYITGFSYYYKKDYKYSGNHSWDDYEYKSESYGAVPGITKIHLVLNP
jgi:hypothetical protein